MIIIPEQNKKTLFAGTNFNSLTIVVKAKFSYSETIINNNTISSPNSTTNKTGTLHNRSSSAKQVINLSASSEKNSTSEVLLNKSGNKQKVNHNTVNSIHTPVKKNGNNFNNGVSSDKSNNKVKSSNKNGNKVGSVNISVEIKQQAIEKEEVSLSKIDSIFNEDNTLEELEQAEQTLKDFVFNFSEEFNTASLNHNNSTANNNLEEKKEKVKNSIKKLVEMQELYYKQYGSACTVTKKLKSLLLKYNEKYRGILKKTNRLKEAKESNNIRNELTTFINREENKINFKRLEINKEELSIFKRIFKTDYSINELTLHKEEVKTNSCKSL